MKPTDGSVQDSFWPLPKFYFRVKYAGLEMQFQEVSGLDTETQVIEYRAGNSPNFSTAKMPGIKKLSDVTLKKGIFKDDQKFWDIVHQTKLGTAQKSDLDIELLDEKEAVVMRWKLSNAFPVKITTTDMKTGNESSAVETIEFAFESIEIENG